MPEKSALSASTLRTKLPFAVTGFTSAFLLFLVQPLIARGILPWFGGGPGVWTTCMLFFQVLLLAGYAYAHLVTRLLTPRIVMFLHPLLLLAAIWLLPITPPEALKPEGADRPEWGIILLLASSVGLQYFLLASTTPLLQAWFSRAIPGYSTYRLYALSNVGSLIALAGYPFVVEPALTLRAQEAAWSWGFGLFAVACSYCAIAQGRVGAGSAPPRATDESRNEDEAAPTPGRRLLWLTLPAAASVLLLAVTNHICQDISVIPFLWVVPLSLYLLTFAICFDREKWYSRGVFGVGLVVAAAGMSVALHHLELGIGAEITIFVTGLFVCCMACHGELARAKPPSRYLTSYYLMIALGGALGGVFVAVVAPLLFDFFLELHVGILACCLLVVVAWLADGRSFLRRDGRRWVQACLLVALLVLGESLRRHADELRSTPLLVTRNFYGVIRLTELGRPGVPWHGLLLLQSGMTEGLQFTSDESRRLPVTFFGPRSGIGLTFATLSGKKPLRVGAIGLGVGTVAAYGKEGDTFRFYEINPAVADLAESHFTYLADSPAHHEIVLGDARISLERESPQDFDIIILDAFSGDAVPVHLLTREAFEIYLRHLRPGGVLAVHTTNESLDLAPVVWKAARHFGLGVARIEDDKKGQFGILRSDWFLLTEDESFLQVPTVQDRADPLAPREEELASFRMWTDNYSNLFQLLYD
jgi:hypothetical protein